MKLIRNVLITAFGFWLVQYLVPGIHIAAADVLFLSALVFSIVNAILRPILILLTLPLTLLTFGLFLLVINAMLFSLTAWLVPGFEVSGFWSAFFGALLFSILSSLINWLL